MKIFKSLKTPNIWKQAFIPLAIFVHKFDCRCGWTGLYHTLCLGSSVFTLLYYCQSDKTGLNCRIVVAFICGSRHCNSDRISGMGCFVGFELSFRKTTTLLQTTLSLHPLLLAKVLKYLRIQHFPVL
jgi:hypothetical protein